MGHLLYLMFRCDFDVMESLESLEEFGGSEHSPGEVPEKKSIWHLTDVCLYMFCLSTELTDLSSQMFVFDRSTVSCHSFTL